MTIDYASPQIIGNWFINNDAYAWSPQGPGCIDGGYGTPIIANNVFWNNLGNSCLSFYYQTGGAIYNNTFVGNDGGIGAARYLDTRNNIIVDSASVGVGDALECPREFYYNNVWNNSPDYFKDCVDLTGSNGNISVDPFFANYSEGNFRLQFISPAQDAGDPDPKFNDPDGSRNDMGAWGGPLALDQQAPPPTPLWTHAWFDLSPWAGQTVSVTFGVIDSISGVARSALSQVITLTETISNPTLSFLYRLEKKDVPGSESFKVIIDPATAPLTEFTLHSDSTNQIGTYLDEVTVGSAYPDVWVSKSSLPTAAFPGEQLAFTLTYGNQGGVPTSGVRLADSLPDELTFVAASLPPLSTTPALVWEVGDLPAKSDLFSIIVTATVSPETPLMSYVINEASISAASLELETANNSAQAVVFVGRSAYLPSISRDF